MEILVNRDRMDPIVTAEQFSQTAPVAPALTEEEINSEVELLQSADLLQTGCARQQASGRREGFVLVEADAEERRSVLRFQSRRSVWAKS